MCLVTSTPLWPYCTCSATPQCICFTCCLCALCYSPLPSFLLLHMWVFIGVKREESYSFGILLGDCELHNSSLSSGIKLGLKHNLSDTISRWSNTCRIYSINYLHPVILRYSLINLNAFLKQVSCCTPIPSLSSEIIGNRMSPALPLEYIWGVAHQINFIHSLSRVISPKINFIR